MTKQKIILVGHIGREPTAEAQTVTVGGVTSPVIKIDGRPLATTRQLAAFFGCDAKHLDDNYRNNRDRFREGTHFVKISGESLRAFKEQPENIGLVAGRSAHQILWTERGAARHAKALTTEAAWTVFEALEDTYFRSQPVPMRAPAIAYSVGKTDTLDRAEQDQLRNALNAAAQRLPRDAQGVFLRTGWSKLKAHFKVSYRDIPRAEFVEALYIVERHVTGYETPKEAARTAIAHAGELQAAIEGFASIANGFAQMMPGLVAVLRDANGVQALTEPPKRMTAEPASNAGGITKRKRL